MPRLFISHSSKDNIQALAFQRWLIGQGWSAEDIFIDLHDIGAGARWRDTLRKANASCEAVLVLASPDSLDSSECQREIMLAEELQKPLIVAILRDLAKTDPRLARWSDIQFVDLSAEPLITMEALEREGRVYRDIKFNLAALQSIKSRLEDLGIAPGSFAWQPAKDGEGPYPGLAAFDEQDAGIYFGREADIMSGLTKLRQMRKRRAPRLLVIVAASGAGKSSFLRAGLWPRLKRDPDFAPLAILRPALGILSGPDGVGQRIAPFFERFGKTKVPGDVEMALRVDSQSATAALSALIAEATHFAAMARQAGNADARAPAPLIAIDQGEELFASENAGESSRFLALLAEVLKQPPTLNLDGQAAHGERDAERVDPYVLITIRADSVETLLQRWPSLGLDAPEALYLPPLAQSAYRDVIVRPAEVYSRQVRRLSIEPGLVHQLTQDAQGADALPLLAFTLEKLFNKFGADGNLTVERYQGIGGIGGSIDGALSESQRQAGPGGTADNLKRLMVPGLATWDPAAGAAKRIVAEEATLTGGERLGLKPLADALVANRLLTRGGGTLEVAHEALLRREPIAGWLDARKDSLRLRDDVLREAKDWTDGGRHAENLVRRGARLEAALALQASTDFAVALAPARAYLEACRKLETVGRRRGRIVQGAIITLLLAVIGGLLARMNEKELKGFAYWATTFKGQQVTAADVGKLKPGDGFSECAKVFSNDRTDGKQISKHCPDMVVVPAGSFKMGEEGKTRVVTIKQQFAVSMFAITFDQWDACVSGGGCESNARPSDQTWGRGTRPAINVDWRDAQAYVAWLNRMAGTSTYRLLSEAEWEYAARAGTTTAFSFGDDEKQLGDYAWYSENSNSKSQPVGEKKPNPWGLFDMHGNVWQWVEDCYASELERPPIDGTPNKEACKDQSSSRVLRGGSWVDIPNFLRSADRDSIQPGNRGSFIGFRLARTLLPPTP